MKHQKYKTHEIDLGSRKNIEVTALLDGVVNFRIEIFANQPIAYGLTIEQARKLAAALLLAADESSAICS